MTAVKFMAMPTEHARTYQSGQPDAYGLVPEKRVSDGDGVPCRHCLADVAAGEEYLILAYRPFPELQPYAETGPIFLHAEPCERHPDNGAMPDLFRRSGQLLIRGYGADDRIVYGTGAVVPTAQLADRAGSLLDRPEIAYLHLRSASNNCYQCRIERG